MKIKYFYLIILFLPLSSFAQFLTNEGPNYNHFNKGYNQYLHDTGIDSNSLGNQTLQNEYYYFYKTLYAKIGVFDAGFYFNHEDIKNTVKRGTNETHYHGTLVAGIISAEASNGKGYRGIIDTKYTYGLFHKEKGSSWSSINSYVKSLCGAFNIFNISLDLENTSFRQSGNNYNEIKHIKNIQKWRTLISSPECKNTMFVVAAGNSDVDAKKDMGSLHYEYVNNSIVYNDLDNVIIVGSIKNGEISENYGKSVDIYAPDSVAGPYKHENGNSTYTKYQSGTSFTAPQVTAAVGAVLKSYIIMKPKDIKEYILNKANLSRITDINGYSRPILNTYQIIDKVYKDRH
jgi:hypothetical protein